MVESFLRELCCIMQGNLLLNLAGSRAQKNHENDVLSANECEWNSAFSVSAVYKASFYLQGSTFGTPGVEKHAHFLRDVSNAIDIRKAIIKSFTLAFSPGKIILEPACFGIQARLTG